MEVTVEPVGPAVATGSLDHEEVAMALTKRPFRDEWLEPVFGRWLERFEPWADPFVSMPRVEEFEEEGTRVVRVELPGLDPERDVEITVTDGTLRVQAERRQETETEEKGAYRSEFRYGSLVRTLPLPAGATENDVKATYQDGILEVRIPIGAERPEVRKIPIARR
jgi:HSP20 family protein